MSRRIRVVALVVLFLLSAAGGVWALDFQPGKWQVTSKVEMPGMPKLNTWSASLRGRRARSIWLGTVHSSSTP